MEDMVIALGLTGMGMTVMVSIYHIDCRVVFNTAYSCLNKLLEFRLS